MNIARRILVKLALVTVVATTGCTFGVLPRESLDPALAAAPPCYSGDVCGSPFDGRGLMWMPDVMMSARR